MILLKIKELGYHIKKEKNLERISKLFLILFVINSLGCAAPYDYFAHSIKVEGYITNTHNVPLKGEHIKVIQPFNKQSMNQDAVGYFLLNKKNIPDNREFNITTDAQGYFQLSADGFRRHAPFFIIPPFFNFLADQKSSLVFQFRNEILAIIFDSKSYKLFKFLPEKNKFENFDEDLPFLVNVDQSKNFSQLEKADHLILKIKCK